MPIVTASKPLESISPDLPLEPTAAKRSQWIDQLRLAMILLVVNMHACVTYSHIGSWYYMSPQEPPMPVKLLFALWQGHLQAFFMGLLFFIAGYFAERSRQRKGTQEFVKERLTRLGLPTLLFVFAINPLTIYLLKWGGQAPNFSYAGYIQSGSFLSGTGPLWFAEALLIFSLIYSLIPVRAGRASMPPITGWGVAGLATVIAVASFAVRIFQPIGTSVLNLQFCFFSQYVAVFALGIWLARRGGLETLASSPLARRAGWVACILGPIAMIAMYVVGGPVKDGVPNPYFGGLNYQSFLTCLWEQFAGVGLGLGAMALAYRKLNNPGALGTWLSKHAFGVYVLHTPVLVAAALLLRPVAMSPFVMAPLLTVLGLAVTFPLAAVAAKIPGIGRVL